MGSKIQGLSTACRLIPASGVERERGCERSIIANKLVMSGSSKINLPRSSAINAPQWRRAARLQRRLRYSEI